MVSDNDLIIAISNSGESRELIDVLNYAKRFGIRLISITKNPDSSLGKAGDIVLRLPLSKEACPLGLAPTSSTTATLVLGDILTVAMIERRGFSKAQFNQRHPGGKLGSILQRVKDIMHKDDEMPILETSATINEIILEMTTKRLGCVGFVDENHEFCGMFTDGDLRRCLNEDLKNAKAIDIMTKNPITVRPDMFASEAIKILNEKKITNLFVVEENKAIGVIHIHDLLKAGIV
jgi:arabinose-5-phosphate isomerase